MKTEELLKLYDEELRIHVTYPEARKESGADVVRFTRKAPAMNFISYTFAEEAQLPRVVSEQTTHFAALDQPFTWKVFKHDPLLHALERTLLASGYELDEDDGKWMMLDVENTPAKLLQPVHADVRRITTLEGLKDIVHVLDIVWSGRNDWVYDRLGGHLQVPGYLSVYAAYVNDAPASIGWTYFPGKNFGTLFAGSTLAEHRKSGLYTAILAARIQEMRRRGIRYALVDAGDVSRPIVMKHGFTYLTTGREYEYKG